MNSSCSRNVLDWKLEETGLQTEYVMSGIIFIVMLSGHHYSNVQGQIGSSTQAESGFR